MKPPAPALEALARQLIAREAAPDAEVEGVAAAAETVCHKLAAHLGPLVGPDGFHALLARALHLARRDHPLFEGVESGSETDPWLEGLRARARAQEPAEVRAAVAALISDFLGLIAHFIGEELTVRIVSRAWPELPPGAAGSAFEGEAV